MKVEQIMKMKRIHKNIGQNKVILTQEIDENQIVQTVIDVPKSNAL